MEPDRAIEIIQSLADGVDPYSGERFPSDSPYQQADLSGQVGGGAGGIGGILASTQASAPAYYHYDFNGNVVNVSSSNQTQLAKYTYSPFGEVLLKEGEFNSRYQFSTKELDDSTGMNYYGYRFYDPQLGRWINKDPLGDTGFVKTRSKRGRFYGSSAEALSYLRFRRGGFQNLYQFVRNRPIDAIDLLGLACTVHFKCTLVSETDQGKCDKHCEYSCTEDWRSPSFGGSLLCDDLPANISMTQGSTASGSLLCKLTKGLCGKKGKCQPDYTTKKIYDNWDIGDRDCSRSECIAGCNAVADAAKKACKKLKGPAKTACKNAAELARTICIDGCNAWCENP